jgi:hypothetical protein
MNLKEKCPYYSKWDYARGKVGIGTIDNSGNCGSE